MSTENGSKLNKLLSMHPQGTVLLSSLMAQKGYSLNLQKRYRNSGWLSSIGSGAMIRTGDTVGYEGAIYALQEAGLTIHPGGRTALSMLGQSHYLELSKKKAILFGSTGENIPAWFRKYDWGLKIEHYNSTFIPSDLGMTTKQLSTFTIKISGSARALMECLYLTPEKQDLVECYEFMEGLNNVRPNIVQQLLEKCTSVKVKRLFLYMAEKADHKWIEYIDLNKIDLGSGKRSIVKNGTYNPKYRITIPKEIEQRGRTV